jgi:hypothetical protein
MSQLGVVHKKIFDFIANEVINGHKDYSKVSPSKLNVDPRAFRKACIDLKEAGVIHCSMQEGGDDPLPICIFDIHFTELTLKELGINQ